nr:hypothetical protein [Tanacetum cinerariifolium]
MLVPKLSENYARCAKCRHPVNGHYCQGCALVREKLKEDLVTYFQNFQNTPESSDDSTNVINAPREPFVIKQDHSVNPPQIDKCCCECGEALDGIYCQRCICKSCGKGAHVGYNCPPKVSIISNTEPCNQTMNNELPQTLPSFDSVPCVSKPNFVDESSKIFNPPPQPPIYFCKFCGSNAQYGHYCTPQAPFNNPEPGYSQDLNFSQNIHNFQQQYFCCDQCGGPHETFQCQQVIFHEPCCENCGGPHENFQCQPVNYCKPNLSYDSCYSSFDQFGNSHPQQYPCCENCGGPHETFQCQPMNEDYCYEKNSCYNSNSFGSDHCQPPQYTIDHPIFDAHNEFLKSQNELFIAQNTIMEQMTQLTSMCELVCQIVQKKQEEKRIEEEQAASARYWKIPACCDDDDDYDYAITPEEIDNSLSMRDEHLDIIPATESDEVIKSSVEDLVPIPSESEEINSGSTTTYSDISLPDYEAFYFNNDHIKEISSGSTTTHSDISLSEYDSLIFDFANEEFVDELAHIISLPEYDCF